MQTLTPLTSNKLIYRAGLGNQLIALVLDISLECLTPLRPPAIRGRCWSCERCHGGIASVSTPYAPPPLLTLPTPPLLKLVSFPFIRLDPVWDTSSCWNMPSWISRKNVLSAVLSFLCFMGLAVLNECGQIYVIVIGYNSTAAY